MVAWNFGNLTFNPFDIFILIIWAIGMISSSAAGFFQVVTKIGAFIISFPLAWVLTPYISPLLTFTTPFWAKYISFVGLTLVIFLLISLLGFILSKVFEEAHLGPLDTFLGLILGFLISSLIVLFLFYVLKGTSFVKENRDNSFLYTHIFKHFSNLFGGEGV